MHAADHTSLTLDLPDAAATGRIGEALAGCVTPGIVVWLEGELGAGKTTLVRALLRALGHHGAVKSPTYALVELYKLSRLCFYHFDFYRFNEPKEYVDAGLAEYFDDKAACFIEWPAKAGDYAPRPDLRLRFSFHGDGRRLLVEACSPRGQACAAAVNPAPTPARTGPTAP